MPIQEDIQVEKEVAKSFPPLPNDIYQVQILDINLGTRPTYKTKNLPDEQKVYEKVFKFQFTVLDHRELRGRNVWNNFVPAHLFISSKTGKNDLYKILEAVLGHELTPEEEANIDKSFINGLIGKQLRIFVETVKKGDKSFDKASKYLSAPDLLNSLTLEEAEKSKVKEKTPDHNSLEDEGDEGKPLVEGDEGYVDVDKIPF